MLLTHIVVPGLAVLFGAYVQSSIGFGVAVVAAPVVVLAAPDLMPGSLLVCGVMVPLMTLAGGRRDVARGPLSWSLLGRLLLTPVGVWVVSVLSPREIGAAVGVLVLGAVALSLRAVEVRPTPWKTFSAGAVAGVAGTAASVGGPFLALTLQHEPPTRARSTLAAFFGAGALLSLVALWIGGQLSENELRFGLSWTPFLLAGHLMAGPTKRFLDAGRLRSATLVLATLASLVVITRAVLFP